MNVRNKMAMSLMLLGLTIWAISQSAEHPSLSMTKAGVERIRAQLGRIPLFDATVDSVKEEVDAEIQLGIDTPIPRDFSGGYTHERHKRNFLILQQAGVLFQILEDENMPSTSGICCFNMRRCIKICPFIHKNDPMREENYFGSA